MNYYTHNDQVAVIIHDTYGSGWFTLHGEPSLLYDYELAAALDAGDFASAQHRLDALDQEYPDQGISTVRANALDIEWVDRSRKFIVHEYDGYESVFYKDQFKWQQA